MRHEPKQLENYQVPKMGMKQRQLDKRKGIIMKINYLNNNNNEAVLNTVLEAIKWEMCDMNISLLDEQMETQERIVSSELRTLEEKKVASEKISNLTNQIDELMHAQSDLKVSHDTFLNTVANTSNEYTSNTVTAVRNVLRLSCCDENKKFFKHAILTEGIAWEEFYKNMCVIHDMNATSVDENGLHTYSKEEAENASSLAVKINGLVKIMFSIPLENEFTTKVNIKFNKTDMNVLHETFVTNANVDMTRSKKNKSVKGLSFRYSIEPIYNNGDIVGYKGNRFKETIAKIAFVKLFAEKTNNNKKADEKIQKLLKITVENGASKQEEDSAKKSIERIQNKLS